MVNTTLGHVTSRSTTTPVLVLGTGLTVLGVVRCLGRKGIPVYCLSTGPENEVRSRWYAGLPQDIGPFANAWELGVVLDSLFVEKAVLLPCSDHWAIELDKLDTSFQKRFVKSGPSAEVLKRFLDKRQFGELLRSVGVPHPSTTVVKNKGDIVGLFTKHVARWFVKPSDSQRFVAKFGVKAFQVDSLDQAISRFEQTEEAGLEILLQEYIPGPPDHHHFVDGFVDRNHKVCACFARRRLRMYPLDFGNSSFMRSESIEVVSEALETLGTLFETTGYRGIFSAEFKFDERDGHFKILEVNCRPWWYVEFAAVCGVDVVEMAYRDALEMPLSEVQDYRTGVGLVFPYFDFLAFRGMPPEDRPTMRELMTEWCRSKDAFFSWDDPMPGFAWMAEWLQRRLVSSVSRFKI